MTTTRDGARETELRDLGIDATVEHVDGKVVVTLPLDDWDRLICENYRTELSEYLR